MWRYCAVVSLVGTFAGCVQYHAAPLEPVHSAEEFAARRLTEIELRDEIVRLLPRTTTGIPRDWDRAELLAVALTQNPQLAMARAEVQAALSHEITEAATPNPDLTLQSEYARHDAHPWLYGVSLNWLLRSSERRRLDIEIAQFDTGNARLQLMDQAWTVRSALAAGLSDWESARRRLSLLAKLAAAQDRLLALETRRVEAGEDAPSELVTGQQARIQIEQQEAELREAVNAAQAAAARALGLPPQALDGVIFIWPDWGEPPPVDENTRRETRERALLSRADLGQAMVAYAAAEAKLQQSVARQYPQFVLSPGYYWDHGIAKFPFDVGFTLPFNRNKGEIAEARAGREFAAHRMLALQADIYGQIVAAERAENIARASADAAQRQLEAARRQQRTADLGLRLGAADVQEQLGAEILTVRAELEVVEMRAQLQNSRNALEDALHAPLSGPELALAKSMPSIVAGGGS
ncbi:MAG: outer membrane protein heavy metal efflux system [Gammaproteobacteria bacterium]|jgi:CRISPR system Cascade subunit CasA|nr:outer membrane protein heavy metal efflux system [Gammaproteobacteria bacterium]